MVVLKEKKRFNEGPHDVTPCHTFIELRYQGRDVL